MYGHNVNEHIINAFPLPVCVLSPSGELIDANAEGKSLFEQSPQDINRASREKNSKQKITIHDKNYLLNVTPLQRDEEILLVTFLDESMITPFINHIREDYQATIDDLQTIFDNSYDVLYVTDGNGKTLRVSSACTTIWGKKPEELVGKSVYELEQEGIYNPSAAIKALREGEKVQLIQQTKTGRRLMVVSTPIKDEHGNINRVVNASRDITEIHELEVEIKKMRVLIEGYRNQLSKRKKNKFNKLIYRSNVMTELMATLPKVASVSSTVLVTGESGVGKEIIVNYIHEYSARKNKPFIKINCAAIPESLLESELFGYEKGAFTGANKNGKVGLFELANEGTLFLDEIGDMPLKLQAKLLRILQEGEIMRIGGNTPIQVDVRIIAATNQDLLTKVKNGEFREDLYYRLNVIPFEIPPLRYRREDIIPLTQHFISSYSHQYNVTKVFSPDLLSTLESYSWPGNVRQLQNIVERLMVTTDTMEVDLHTIPNYILDSIQETTKESVYSNQDIDIKNIVPLKDAVHQVEENLLKVTADKCANLNEMAKILQVNQSTISRKMQKYGITL